MAFKFAWQTVCPSSRDSAGEAVENHPSDSAPYRANEEIKRRRRRQMSPLSRWPASRKRWGEEVKKANPNIHAS